MKLIDDYKYRSCEEIFASGKFNLQLFTHCLDKVFKEEEQRKEEEERIAEENRPKVSIFQRIKNGKLSLILSIIFIIMSMALLGSHYYAYSSGFQTFFK